MARKRIKNMPELIAAVEKTMPKATFFTVEGEYKRYDGRKGKHRSIDFTWRIYRADIGGAGWDGKTPQSVWDSYSRYLGEVKRQKYLGDIKPMAQAKHVGYGIRP